MDLRFNWAGHHWFGIFREHRDVEANAVGLIAADTSELRGEKQVPLSHRITLELDYPAIMEKLHTKLSIIS